MVVPFLSETKRGNDCRNRPLKNKLDVKSFLFSCHFFLVLRGGRGDNWRKETKKGETCLFLIFSLFF